MAQRVFYNCNSVQLRQRWWFQLYIPIKPIFVMHFQIALWVPFEEMVHNINPVLICRPTYFANSLDTGNIKCWISNDDDELTNVAHISTNYIT